MYNFKDDLSLEQAVALELATKGDYDMHEAVKAARYLLGSGTFKDTCGVVKSSESENIKNPPYVLSIVDYENLEQDIKNLHTLDDVIDASSLELTDFLKLVSKGIFKKGNQEWILINLGSK